MVKQSKSDHVKILEQSEKLGLVGFLRKHAITIISILLAVIGILATILIGLPGFQSRQLNYCIYPNKSQVYKAGVSSRITVQYDNQKIDEDVTVVQISFWNSGSLPIKRTDILKPLVIKAVTPQSLFSQNNKEVQIFEASTLMVTRDIINLSIDQSNINQGKITLNWDILENNDGAILQIIYKGTAFIDFMPECIIVGQPNIKRTDFQFFRLPIIIFIIMILLLLGCIFFVIYDAIKKRERNQFERYVTYMFRVLVFIILALTILIGTQTFTSDDMPERMRYGLNYYFVGKNVLIDDTFNQKNKAKDTPIHPFSK